MTIVFPLALQLNEHSVNDWCILGYLKNLQRWHRLLGADRCFFVKGEAIAATAFAVTLWGNGTNSL
jgi:hypothetical protein